MSSSALFRDEQIIKAVCFFFSLFISGQYQRFTPCWWEYSVFTFCFLMMLSMKIQFGKSFGLEVNLFFFLKSFGLFHNEGYVFLH